MLLAPERPDVEPLEADLLIREARRRQRRRRLAVTGLVIAVLGGVAIATTLAPSSRPVPLLSRPLHLPSLGPGGRCPVSSGSTWPYNSGFGGGPGLGHGPVRVHFADPGDVLRGRVQLGTGGPPGWFALETIWFAMPGYNGPFVVRGGRLGARGPMQVQPDYSGLNPGSGPLVVPAGPTINSFPTPGPGTYRGYRTVPGSTWVKSPGCYAWQVDGRGFSEVIVADLLPYAR